MTVVVMVILAAAIAAWVLAPLWPPAFPRPVGAERGLPPANGGRGRRGNAAQEFEP